MSSRSIAHGTSSVSGTHHASATTHASSAKPHATTAPARRSNRFAAVAARIHERDPSGTDGERAYTDGAMTAKIFAAHGLSRLGFVDQYVADTLAALGPAVIPPASAAAYSTEFLRGLRDAEDQIRSELQS
jgi:glucan 1,3-beta-glucosidase